MSIRVNPNNLPRTGGKYYPAESVRLHEEGVCVVKVSVSAQGDVKVLGLTHSSGFPRLDDACAAAFSSGELLPATRNSTAIDSTIELPVAWRLGEAGK
jgi:protein TonB